MPSPFLLREEPQAVRTRTSTRTRSADFLMLTPLPRCYINISPAGWPQKSAGGGGATASPKPTRPRDGPRRTPEPAALDGGLKALPGEKVYIGQVPGQAHETACVPHRGASPAERLLLWQEHRHL